MNATSRSAFDVAEYVLNKCTQAGTPISNLQLQKILYFVQRENLRNIHKPLFEDDFIAWPHGPVILDLYKHFCGYGAMPIMKATTPELNLDDQEKDLLNSAVQKLATLNPYDLVGASHAQGGAWSKIYNNTNKGRSWIISKGLIENES